MAPIVEPEVVLLIPWPHFQAFAPDGSPLIGGKLYTYAANTTVPKAAYHDPYLLSPHANPIILRDDGSEVIWLDGFYHLRLEDRHGVQLWDIPSYEWEVSTTVPPGGIISGSTDGVANAVTGESVIQVPNLVPTGYRVEGVIVRIDTTFGASNGLQQIAIGDGLCMDGWGVVGLEAGVQTIQRDFRRGDRPIPSTAYTVLLAAIGGRFDSAGVMSVRAHWSSIGGWS